MESILQRETAAWVSTTHFIDAKTTASQINSGSVYKFRDGDELSLVELKFESPELKVRHVYVSNDKHVLGFFWTNDIYSSKVEIRPYSAIQYTKLKSIKKVMNTEIRKRMMEVIGMTNFSFCFCNSEHVANYVTAGRWYSKQMTRGQSIMSFFSSSLLLNSILLRRVNTFPSPVRYFKENRSPPIYSFYKPIYVPTHMQYYQDSDDDTFNILVVGPTGAGKSHLINIFFNETVCHVDSKQRSVSQDVCFVHGEGKTFDKDKIVIADTLGLCDTEYDNKDVINMIMNRVSSNMKKIDAVFIVFQANRLLQGYVSGIKEIMWWLKYSKRDNHRNFVFVGTHAEYLNEIELENLRKEAIELLGITTPTDDYEPLIYTGFLPEDSLNPKMTTKLQLNLERMEKQLQHIGTGDRLDSSMEGLDIKNTNLDVTDSQNSGFSKYWCWIPTTKSAPKLNSENQTPITITKSLNFRNLETPNVISITIQNNQNNTDSTIPSSSEHKYKPANGKPHNKTETMKCSNCNAGIVVWINNEIQE